MLVAEPDLDTSIGTTIRKMFDSVAQALANADANSSLGNISSYAIDSLSGSALDDFVSTFAFQRFSAARATGTVTFSVAAVGTTSVVIPVGSSVSTATTPPIIFNTLTTAIIGAGSATVDIPVQAVIGGVSGNVAANTISAKVSPLTGVAAVANLLSTTNGTDAESDQALIARFKATIFRAFTGTAQCFAGTALENPNVTQVNVVGSSETHNEQIQINYDPNNPTLGSYGISVVQDAQFIYDFNYTFGANLAANDILTPDVSYSFTVIPAISDPIAAPIASSTVGGILSPGQYSYQIVFGGILGHLPSYTNPSPIATIGVGLGRNAVLLSWPTPPPNTTFVYVYSGGGTLLGILGASETTWSDTGSGYPVNSVPLSTTNSTGFTVQIQSLDSSSCPNGIYDLQFEYLPAASRNSPTQGVTNKVDVYVVGSDAAAAEENVPFGTANLFSSDPTSSMYYERFMRDDYTNPVPGNIFLPLSFAPVVDLPSSLLYGSSTYMRDTDYFLINDVTNLGYTSHSLSGVEWVNGTNMPTSGTLIDVAYTYNALPYEVESDIQQWRLVCYDVWVHQAQQAFLDIYLVVILSQGYTAALINPMLFSAISAVCSAVGFDGVLQTSAIISAAAQTPGIAAVRFATSTDAQAEDAGGGYGIQQVVVTASNTTPPTTTTTLVQNWALNGRAIDAYFSDDTLPVLNEVFLDVRALNSLNTGA